MTDTTAMVTWTTDEAATSGVSYNDCTAFVGRSGNALTRSADFRIRGA